MQISTYYKSDIVKSYIDTLQAFINEQSRRSSTCKVWLMTITTAMIALCKTSQMHVDCRILWGPCILFALLDAYYLGMEEYYKKIEKSFLSKAKDEDLSESYKYEMPKFLEAASYMLQKLGSLSVLPFYLMFAVLAFYLNKYL